MNNESEYYFMCRKDDQAYPLVKIVDEEYKENSALKLMHLEFNDTILSNPVMADFLSGSKDIVTKRIADIIKGFLLKGVGFIPTELTTPKGDIIDDYICVLVDCNTFEALNKEKSVYTRKRVSYNIQKLVLDQEALKKIPEEIRLAFHLREAPGYYLYHKSIVDAIMAANPTGVFFQNIENFNDF